MHPHALQLVSPLICLIAVIAILWRIRQVKQRHCITGNLLMLAMASLALAYLQKGIARIEGDIAAPVDIWRDGSLLLVMWLRVILAGREGRW